jgi:hypothetical protein
VQNLSAALEREVESFNSKIKAREEATASAQQGLQAELERARDQCDELQRQMRLAERQLARLRRPKVLFPPIRTILIHNHVLTWCLAMFPLFSPSVWTLSD